jgi:hypothetical protein
MKIAAVPQPVDHKWLMNIGKRPVIMTEFRGEAGVSWNDLLGKDSWKILRGQTIKPSAHLNPIYGVLCPNEKNVTNPFTPLPGRGGRSLTLVADETM